MSLLPGKTQEFYKMQGSGNDFIVIDNRDKSISQNIMPAWATTLCPRAFRIGADGIIFLEMDETGHGTTAWHFFNADGSRAEMCGNGARCATLLAHLLGMAPAEHSMLTDAGPIRAKVSPDKGYVEVQLTPARDMRFHFSLQLTDTIWTAHFANTGVPHTVLITDQLSALDVRALGAAVRYHDIFQPAGTNVNFIQIDDRTHLRLRTYERGVEDETYACGTGAAAAVAVAHALELCEPTVTVTTSGGEQLQIRIEGPDIFLRGAAQIIYRGEFSSTALGLE